MLLWYINPQIGVFHFAFNLRLSRRKVIELVMEPNPVLSPSEQAYVEDLAAGTEASGDTAPKKTPPTFVPTLRPYDGWRAPRVPVGPPCSCPPVAPPTAAIPCQPAPTVHLSCQPCPVAPTTTPPPNHACLESGSQAGTVAALAALLASLLVFVVGAAIGLLVRYV